MHDRSHPPADLNRYPGYDVLAKRNGPSWNDKTREVIAERLSVTATPLFFSTDEFVLLQAIAARIVPQPATRPAIPVAALVDRKLHTNISDGYRPAGMPRQRDAWRSGLHALDAEARYAFERSFVDLSTAQQDQLLHRAEAGQLTAADWGDMRCDDFFKRRLLHDIVLAYYSHPTAWSEIGWGGPASPRGYVRLGDNERDPWEAAEASPGHEADAERINRHVR
ncbi:gluconate 2-dehydrogenase subunit 3 family protein [Bradyrhizobium sp. HKCCYLS2038]|uniref:gluconate 2-dehydrogenase subunit 3 family protein n=1 Tax=unclassified Bradyrhizobium TaxID=2631580 RepID=UPI003EB71E9D